MKKMTIMKHLFFTISFLCISFTTLAQQPVKRLSVVPKIGVNLASVTNFDFTANETVKPASSKIKAGLSAGVELEYQLTDKGSISAGLLYSMQGVGYDDYYFAFDQNNYEGASDWRLNLQYINMPLLFHYYIAKDLALMAGIQPGVLIDKYIKNEYAKWHIDENGKEVYDTHGEIKDKNLKMRTFDIAIPVGISYEWQSVIIEARYNIGLISPFKYSISNGHNSVFAFSVGYRI